LGPGIGLPLALLLAYGLYFLQAREDMPLFAHFIVLALAAFPCVAPLGIRWPGRNPSNSIGRTGFILLAAPYFLLAGARAWPGLDHALSVMWSLIWSPIDRIPVVAPLVAVSIVFPFVKGRITDVGAKRWLHVGLLALFFAQFAALLIEALDPYAGALNTALAASLLLLCLWPSRNERLTQNEEIAPRREAEP
jgi:hypothetical protein